MTETLEDDRMRFAIRPLSLLPLCLSCTAYQGGHSQLIREIDAAVVVPKDAQPLRKYAGYFAIRPDGKIEVFYDADVRDGIHRWPTEGCSEIAHDDTLVDVPCGLDDRPVSGERRWVNYDDMPDAADGGCSIINVVYDPTAHRVTSVFCNGTYS